MDTYYLAIQNDLNDDLAISTRRQSVAHTHTHDCCMKIERSDSRAYVLWSFSLINRKFNGMTTIVKYTMIRRQGKKVKVNRTESYTKRDVAFSSSFLWDSIYNAQINRDQFSWFTGCGFAMFTFFCFWFICFFSPCLSLSL